MLVSIDANSRCIFNVDVLRLGTWHVILLGLMPRYLLFQMMIMVSDVRVEMVFRYLLSLNFHT